MENPRTTTPGGEGDQFTRHQAPGQAKPAQRLRRGHPTPLRVITSPASVSQQTEAGPSIGRLLEVLTTEQPTLLQLQIALIKRLGSDFDHNKDTLTRIRWLLALQALLVLAEAVILLLGFYELT